MINVDFPIQKLYFKFKTFGTANVTLVINDKTYQNVNDIVLDNISESENTIKIIFDKTDSTDVSSYAILEKFEINSGDFISAFKNIDFIVDQKKHQNQPQQYSNNAYFGRIGHLQFIVSGNDSLLKKAGWLIANNNFQNPKENTRGNPYREKNFKNIYEDFKYIFTGCLAPKDKLIIDYVNDLKIKEISNPLDFPEVRSHIQNWINNSQRLNFKNFEKFDYFNYGGGTISFLESFINRCSDKIYLAPKYYYFIGELLKKTDIKICNSFENIENNQRVLFEYPSPWYSNKTIENKIAEAKSKNCYVGVDLTWAPVATNIIDLDLDLVDEVYFSMNKAWPINDLRPSWRWSKTAINDAISFQQNWNYYQKPQPNIFLKLIQYFACDYTYKKYIKDIVEINEKFNLDPTEVLWFTKNDVTKLGEKGHISEHYFLDEFVCIRKLIDHKGEYFW